MSTQPFNSDGGFSTTANITAGNIVGNANVNVVTSGGTWVFDNTGGTIFPTLNVDLHNGGSQTGQVLQFGDGNQQAIITGPAPIVEGYNAQRLIIQGQNGGDGEGGDVYVWGGDSNVNGGDIKIYAGDADTAGIGGNIHITGGRGTTDAGEITLIGGRNDGGVGARVDLTGGLGSTDGGNINLTGGYGALTGGNVNIAGGVSGNGPGSAGNINITSSGGTWNFDNTGNLNLPNTGVVYETNIPFGGLSGKTIALKPYGGTSADQQLLVYPTAGADANHLHLTSGNLYNTELFLGNDDLYVKLANTGNIVINSNDSGGNTAQWNFGTDGNLTTPGSSGDITGANLIVAETLSAYGNIVANNAILTNYISSADMGVVGNINSGNLLTSGFLCAVGNIIGLETIYAGNGATWQSQVQLANVLYVGADVGEAYIQAAMINTGGNGSADWVAYASNGNTDQGWVDMGFTGNTFSDPDYTVTGPNDGYVFVQGTVRGNARLGGNLVLSTGSLGNANDIIFSTGGFQTGNIRARFDNSTNTFSVYGNITGNIYPQSGAVLYVDGGRTDTYTANGTINFPYKTVQAALDDATANTTISVAPGLYSENIVMPDLDGICIAGSSEMNTTIANAAPGHTFSWVPAGSVGNTISKFCLTNLEFINTDTTGTYHTLHIDATNVTYPSTFIGEEMDLQTVDFEGSQSQSNTTVYLNNVGAQFFWHNQIYGGALTVINPGEFRSTSMVIGNTGDPHDFNVTYDGNLPRNGLGRNDITLAAGSAVFGNVNLNGHPIYQEDVDSVVVGNLNGANLSTFYASGRDYSPTILAYGQHGVVGGTGGSINLTFPDPNTSGASFNFVDFSNGHILGKVSLTKANLIPVSARGYAVVQGQAQFDTTAANGISANGYVALDLRGANFNQSTLQATGAATIDRSVVTITSQSATTAGNVISISPPLAAGATYTTAVTPNSQSTVWATNKTTSNVKVWASANTTVDITIIRNT